MKSVLRVLPLSLAMFSLTACEPAKAPPAAMLPVAQIDGIDISEPRLRLPPGGRDVTAAYLTLTNNQDVPRKLVGAESPDAARIELHAHLTGADGVKQMRQVNEVVIPAKGTAVLAPGGLHLMVFGIKPDVKPGDQIKITLTFDNARRVSFQTPVVENPSQSVEGDKAHGGHQH